MCRRSSAGRFCRGDNVGEEFEVLRTRLEGLGWLWKILSPRVVNVEFIVTSRLPMRRSS